MFKLIYINCNEFHLLKCFSQPQLAITNGDVCIVEVKKLQEFGHVVAIAEQSGEPSASAKKLPVVLRRATLQDQAKASENILFSKSAFRQCQEKIEEYQLAMNLVRVYYSFDRSFLTVVFTSEERIDFRQLVQHLTTETHTHIKMQQIGVRDASGFVGGMAICGRRLCCASWLKEFDNVHIRMAKIQGLPLSPAVVNGMCGRLKCCLRFEHNCYKDMARSLPRAGVRVECSEGQGRVLETRVLSQRVKIILDNQQILEVDAHDLKMLGRR